MRLRNLGRTGLRVSEMGLGTWGLSGDAYGPVDDAERELVLRRALEMGLTLLDTADVYGAGRMERLIGRVLGEGLDAVVVTKGGTDRTTSPARKCFDPPYLRASVERSLKRLQREAIDVYLLHCPDVESVTRSETVGLLKELRQEGKIRSWGVSAGDTAVGRAALRSGAEVIEIAYNLVNPSELHRLAGDVMVTGAGVLARFDAGVRPSVRDVVQRARVRGRRSSREPVDERGARRADRPAQRLAISRQPQCADADVRGGSLRAGQLDRVERRARPTIGRAARKYRARRRDGARLSARLGALAAPLNPSKP